MSSKINVSDLLNENGKVTFKPISKKNLYLPPITSVLIDLGFKASLQNLAQYASDEFNKPTSLSKSSIRNISEKGISVKSANKLVAWFRGIIPTSFEKALIKRATSFKLMRVAMSGSTSSEWYPFIHGQELSLKKEGLSDLFKPLFNFLKVRCETESFILRSARRDIKSGKLDPNDLKMTWERYITAWSLHSLVPKEQLDSMTSFIGEARDASDIKEKDETPAVLPIIYLTYDFYLDFIAHYEVSFLMYMNTYVKKVPDLESKKWILTKSIENYVAPLEAANSEASSSDSHNTRSPRTLFGSMLKVLKDEMEELTSNENQGSNDGWRKLASFIEIETKDSLEPLAQRQYDQLKQWRKGKDIPSFKNLSAFIINYLKYVGKSGSEEVEMCFRIMLMLDRIESRMLATVKDKSAAKDHIKTVLAQYSSYYHACLDQELSTCNK
jgi:hypothetical protein